LPPLKKKKKKKKFPDLRISQVNTAYKYDALTDWATGEHW